MVDGGWLDLVDPTVRGRSARARTGVGRKKGHLVSEDARGGKGEIAENRGVEFHLTHVDGHDVGMGMLYSALDAAKFSLPSTPKMNPRLKRAP
jgi:hypothetical protein